MIDKETAVRVILDNDYAGDPDGLVQLAHHVLASGAEVLGVISSRFKPLDFEDTAMPKPEDGVALAEKILQLCGREKIPVMLGRMTGDANCVEKTPTVTDFILEAANSDDERPLVIACGGALTEVAIALKFDPGIASKISIVWIGGEEHPQLLKTGLMRLPGGPLEPEYNLSIDIPAAQYVLNQTNIPITMVPRYTYRQTIVSMAELAVDVKPQGPLGKYLYEALDDMAERAVGFLGYKPVTYTLGDSPLVLLTSLLGMFDGKPASCDIQRLPAPVIGDDGYYTGALQSDRQIDVMTRTDMRLIQQDLVSRLKMLAASD